MTAQQIMSEWKSARLRAFTWRFRLSIPRKLVLCLSMAGLTGLMAQVRIPLGFTPVPITGQVFAVLLAGVVLGRNYAAVSQALYLAVGAAGVPWFAGGSAGIPIGPAGGYLIGFVFAAWIVGALSDRHVAMRSIPAQVALMMVAVAVIYAFGALQFAVVMRTGLWPTLAGAVLPFILVDLAKAVAVAFLTTSILPKEPFGPETRPHTPREV